MRRRLSDIIIESGPYRAGDAIPPELARLTAADMNALRDELLELRGRPGRESPAEKIARLGRTHSAMLGGPVGIAECGCPNTAFGTAPILHICSACGFEGMYEQVHLTRTCHERKI